MGVPQFGKPILTPDEASKLSPEERARVEVPTAETISDLIPRGDIRKRIRRRRGGGGSRRRSGGGTAPSTISAEQRARELAEQKARDIAIQKQRADAQRIKERSARINILRQKVRKMSVKERSQFFKEQAESIRVSHFQKLQRQGKRLTPEAERLVRKKEAEPKGRITIEKLPGRTITKPIREPEKKGFFKRIQERVPDRLAVGYGTYIKAISQEIKATYPKKTIKTKEIIKKIVGDKIVFQYKFATGFIKRETQKFAENEEKIKLYGSPEAKEAQQIRFLFLRGFMFTPAGIGTRVTTTTRPLKQRAKPEFRELITKRRIGPEGKIIRESKYQTITQTQPPRLRITQSLYRGQLGKPPLKIKYLKPVYTKTFNPFRARINKEFLTIEAKTARVGKISKIAGTSGKVELKHLTGEQKFLAGRLETTSGVPLKKGAEFYVADMKITKVGKIRLGKYEEIIQRRIRKPTYTFPTGPKGEKFSTPQKISRFDTLTEVQLLKETDKAILTKSRIVFKDTSKPFFRKAGKTPFLKGRTLELKKIFGEETPQVNFISFAAGKKTPLGQTFQKTIQKNIHAIKVPPPPTPKAIVRTKTDIIPSLTKETIKYSAFAGTGLYERTEGRAVYIGQPSQFSQGQLTIQQPKLSDIQNVIPSQDKLKGLYLGSSTKQIQKQIQKPIQKEIQKEITKVIQKPIPKLIQKPSLKLIQKPIPKFPISPFFPYAPPTIPRTPKEPIFKFPKFKGAKEFPSPKNLYPVLLRRFGIFRTIGFGKTPQQAFQIGREKAIRTLGVTFKIPGLTKKPSKTPGFKTKKTKEGFLFIELPKFRLSKPEEVKEIQFFKAMKGGRK